MRAGNELPGMVAGLQFPLGAYSAVMLLTVPQMLAPPIPDQRSRR